MPTYTNPSLDQQPSPQQIYYLDNKCAIFTCNGNPEGLILANTGSIAVSDNGSLYRKSTDDALTGWIVVSSNIGSANILNNVFVDPVNRANVGAGVTTVINVPIPIGILKSTGDFIECVALYDISSVNSKTITCQYGGQTLNSAPWNNTTNLRQLIHTSRVYRLTATTCRSYVWSSLPFLGQTEDFAQLNDITVANMDSNILNFVTTVQATNNNEIIQRVAHINSLTK